LPKKRKKPRKPASRSCIRKVPTPSAAPSSPDGAWADGPTDADYVDGRQEFFDTYPTVPDAVRAAERGEVVEWTGDIDGSLMRHTVKLTSDGPVVEQAIYVGNDLECMVESAWLQSEDRSSTETAILAALGDIHELLRPRLEERVREVRPEYWARILTPFAERSADRIPCFGWRATYSTAGLTDWDDCWDIAAWNMSASFSMLDPVDPMERDEVAARLQSHGVLLIVCEGCGEAITNRHPAWESVWVTPCLEEGPLCPSPTRTPEPYGPNDECGHPHHPQRTRNPT